MVGDRWLFVNPYGVGDVLCSIPLLNAVRMARPSATIGYVCNRRTASLVHALPGVNEVIVFEKDEFRECWRRSKPRWCVAVQRFARAIRSGRWDTAIDLSLNWQVGAALMALGIPRRFGFDFRRRGRFLTHRLPLAGFDHRPVAEHYLDLLELLKIPHPLHPMLELPVSPAVLRDADEWLARQGVTGDQPIIGIVPGGGASWGPNAYYKRWPAQHFAVLADRLVDTIGGQPALLGDRVDEPACDAVAKAMRHRAMKLEPAPSLLMLAGILKRCRLVVGNDSGALHLAVAVSTPSVTIFGPASPVVYGPYPVTARDPSDGWASRHRVAAKPLACRPCYTRFRLPPCPWGLRCLTMLSPDDVYQTASTLLAA